MIIIQGKWNDYILHFSSSAFLIIFVSYQEQTFRENGFLSLILAWKSNPTINLNPMITCLYFSATDFARMLN